MRGFSLPVVMFTVSLGGALAVGSAFVTRQLAAGTRQESRGVQLDGLVEEWVLRSVAGWDTAAARALAPGNTVLLRDATGPGGRIAVWATRTAPNVYFVVGEAATISKPLLRRRLGIIARFGPNGLELVPGRAWGDLH